MRQEKSARRLFMENLGGVIGWLSILTLVVGAVAGTYKGLGFVPSMVIGGSVAVPAMLLIIIPLLFTGYDRKRQEVERGWEGTGKELHELHGKHKDANRFIKEFVVPRVVLEHMNVLQDDYRGRVTRALIAVRDLPATERNSVSKLHDAIQILVRSRDEVSRGEQALRDACALAVAHGFTPRPPEYYLGLPMPGVEVRPETIGS